MRKFQRQGYWRNRARQRRFERRVVSRCDCQSDTNRVRDAVWSFLESSFDQFVNSNEINHLLTAVAKRKLTSLRSWSY